MQRSRREWITVAVSHKPCRFIMNTVPAHLAIVTICKLLDIDQYLGKFSRVRVLMTRGP